MSLRDRNRIREYVEAVCAQVRFQDLHPQIRLELEAHIEDHLQDLTRKGMAPDAALDQALTKMGDPSTLGEQLNVANRPPLEWRLLLLVGSLLGSGLFTLYTIEAHGLIPHQIFARSLVFTLLGLVAVGVTTLADYRRILPFSRHLYAISVGALALSQLSIDVFALVNPANLAPYFLLIGLAGMFTRWEWERSSSQIWALALLLLPTLLFITTPAMGPMILYTVGFSSSWQPLAQNGSAWSRLGSSHCICRSLHPGAPLSMESHGGLCASRA